MKLICSFSIPVLLLVFSISRTARMDAADKLDVGIIVEGSDETQDDDITLRWSYKVEYEGDDVRYSNNFSLINGGEYQAGIALDFQFLNSEFKPVFDFRSGATGRCHNLNKLYKKENAEQQSHKVDLSTREFREEAVYAAMRIFLVKGGQQSPGSEVPDWTKSTEIATALKDLKPGDTKKFEDWQFKKLK